MQVFDAGHDHSRRDLKGTSGQKPLDFTWPNGARVCVSFVINYEEGSENTLLNEGDTHAESFLTENGVAPTVLPPLQGRELSRESSFAYGSRQGLDRILRLLKANDLPSTSWSVGKAVELNPEAAKAMQDAKCEVGSHSYRWTNYAGFSEDEERDHIEKTISALEKATPGGTTPLGWYTGRCSLATRRLVYEAYAKRGLATQYYDSDAYDDDLPYYLAAPTKDGKGEPMLVIPYTLDVNDMKFGISPGFATGAEFGQYCSDALRVLVDEAEQYGRSSMLTVALHCRIVGRPGRFGGLMDFVKELVAPEMKSKVWVASRGEIAQFWREKFPAAEEKRV